jgi:DNA polymerase-3 subunit epsilon
MQWFSHASSLAPAHGFAAIDMETTGLSPHVDRVVEIAVIQLDRDLSPCGEFVTLINPGRDIGATHVHRITARDVAGAPRFEHVAPMLLDALRGRVVVAHNVQFDLRMLHAEFARMGIDLPELPVMCTMQLAPRYLRGLPARSLAACCLSAGITLDGAHAAAVDARAVGRLLACYARTDRPLATEWAWMLAQAARVSWPALPPVTAQLVTREIVARSRAQDVPFLARLVQQLPRAGTDARVESYLAALDSVLEDRRVTTTEAESLRDLAVSLGVGADALVAAHQMYLRALAVTAWADGVITDGEYADLGEVAALLGFPLHAVDIELAAARGVTPQMTVPVNGRVLRAGDAGVSPGLPPLLAASWRRAPPVPGSRSPARSAARPGSWSRPTRTPSRVRHAAPVN